MTAARHSTVTEHRTTAQVLAIVVQRIKQFQTGSGKCSASPHPTLFFTSSGPAWSWARASRKVVSGTGGSPCRFETATRWDR